MTLRAFLVYTALDGSTVTVRNPFAACPHCDDDVEVHEEITDTGCDRMGDSED